MARLYHMAHLFGAHGQVSPLCAEKPRAIDLTRAVWTLRWEAVTCPKCLKLKPPGVADAWGNPEPLTTTTTAPNTNAGG